MPLPKMKPKEQAAYDEVAVGTGIMEVLKRADIVLLFYTTAARISKFIQEQELPISLDRSDAGRMLHHLGTVGTERLG